jgi:hypothetical protein
MGTPDKIYNSVEDANADALVDSVAAATKAGFTLQATDNGHVLCQKPDSYELVDVFPDGSWEYQNIGDDGKAIEMSGPSAVLLALYLHSDENKAMFKKYESEA